MYLSTETLEYEFANISFGANSCYYCGSVGNTIDHVPPTSTRRMLESSAMVDAKIPPYYEVPCCKECNSALSDNGNTLRERKAYIAGWLRKRYSKLLNMPGWSGDELALLSPNLRRMIQANLQKREIIKARVQWARQGTNAGAPTASRYRVN